MLQTGILGDVFAVFEFLFGENGIVRVFFEEGGEMMTPELTDEVIPKLREFSLITIDFIATRSIVITNALLNENEIPSVTIPEIDELTTIKLADDVPDQLRKVMSFISRKFDEEIRSRCLDCPGLGTKPIEIIFGNDWEVAEDCEMFTGIGPFCSDEEVQVQVTFIDMNSFFSRSLP